MSHLKTYIYSHTVTGSPRIHLISLCYGSLLRTITLKSHFCLLSSWTKLFQQSCYPLVTWEATAEAEKFGDNTQTENPTELQEQHEESSKLWK